MTHLGWGPERHIFQRKVTPGPSLRDTPPSAARRQGLGTGPWARGGDGHSLPRPPAPSRRGHAGSWGAGEGGGAPAGPPCARSRPGTRPALGGGHTPKATPTAPGRGSPAPPGGHSERGGGRGPSPPAGVAGGRPRSQAPGSSPPGASAAFPSPEPPSRGPGPAGWAPAPALPSLFVNSEDLAGVQDEAHTDF